MRAYFLRFWLAFDLFVQACAWWWRGPPGITISSQAETARFHGHRWGVWLCKVLDWMECDHCKNARLNDMRRAKEAYDALREWR